MSYTNKTTHYELPQYVATDKPKYLTDFNETMATIDGQMYTNATAAATAQTAAEGAQSTADGAVSSIGTLNTQINGDPTDPSDTGLAGDVSALDGDVNTIQSLLGNGTPTTSNQTVIGAINAIEGAIAPAEDSATLGANYATGAQFARGGVVYEALTDLTSGTAFTSLTLNTDYKVADTLVKQIADVASDADAIIDVVNSIGCTIRNFNQSAVVTADGVKTSKELIEEAIDAFISAAEGLTDCYVEVTKILWYDLGMYPVEHNVYNTDSSIDFGGSFHVTNINAAHTNVLIRDVDISHGDVTDAAQVIFTLATNTAAYSDGAVEVPASGVRFGVNYRVYHKEKRVS